MKKTTLAVAAAVLLLAAVLSTAGCVNSTTDPVVGAWYTEDGGSTGGICLMFAENHTGVYIYDAGAYETEDGTPGNGTAASFFDWTADGDNAYSVAFDDGESAARLTLNPDEKTFSTWNDILYTKVMDETGALSPDGYRPVPTFDTGKLSGQSSDPGYKPIPTIEAGKPSGQSSKPPATKYPIRDTAGI